MIRMDLTGQQFGEWTVLGRGTKKQMWLCKCSCGVEKEVNRSNLRNGASKSCGCNHGPMFKDISGLVFHEWTVLKYASNKSWLCKCSCGKEVIVEGKALRKGESKSCGHNHGKGIKHSDIAKANMSKARKGDKNHSWKGGVRALNLPVYDTYIHKLQIVEQCRRDPNDSNILNVKCTYCGKWITPKASEVGTRIKALQNKGTGENRFYCPGNSCRSQCSIYKRIKYPKGFKNGSSREVPAELRHAVFERDNFTCQRCGSTQDLNCHHILPATQNPIFSADPENCITLCRTCHKAAHSDPGCRYVDLRCPDPQPPIALSNQNER